MSSCEPGAPQRFALRGASRPVELDRAGIAHPRSVHFGGGVSTPYQDVTHLTVGPGGMRLGTRSGSFWFRRADFREAGAHRALADAIRARIAARPGGGAQLERMAALDVRLAQRTGAPVSAVLTAACVLAFLLGPAYHETGAFDALLVRMGEWWRLLTAHFLHWTPTHLAVNGLGLSVLGSLTERSLGSRTAAALMMLAALGATAGSLAAGYGNTSGASGVVAGLVGALLWIELRRPESVPVTWRLPRRIFVAVCVLEALLLARLPQIAHATHAGGLAAGALGAAALGPRSEGPRLPRRALRAANAASLLVLLLAGAAWIWNVRAPGATLARRGEVLLAEAGVAASELNDLAWRIVTSAVPSAPVLDVARRLAERAVAQTDRSVPSALDTLAEVYFLGGDAEKARELGAEAVRLAPSEPYFREQLRRFRGERAADDRPSEPRPGVRV